MTTNSPARSLSPITLGRFFRLIGGVVAATVGLIFLIVGLNLLASQQWATATGTVQSCTTTYTGTGSASSRQVHHMCDVAWQENGVGHKHSVDFGHKAIADGATYQIKVSGDNAVLPSPAWVGILTFLIGAGLVATCVYLIVRSRRTPRTLQGPAGTTKPTLSR